MLLMLPLSRYVGFTSTLQISLLGQESYIYPRRTYLGLENRRQYIFNVGADRGAGWYWGFDCTCQQLKPLVFTPLGKTGCFCDNWPCCPTTIGFYVLVESRFPALDNAIER